MIEPLELTFAVDCPPAHAFEVWTSRFEQWWPPGHSVSGDPATIVLEPRVGGRIYERTHDGEEIDWGEVTVWEPPGRLGYLWHIRRDRADATEVDVHFLDAGDGTTQLRIVHRGWERLRAGAEEWRDTNRGGWNGLLPYFFAYLATTQNKET
jgi:hypothetical protein